MFKKNQEIEVEGVKYKLEEQKGSGGSGTVWSAFDNGNKVAIKYINQGKLSTDKLGRFKQEIAFSKKSNHKNVIKVTAEGSLEEDTFYVMPYFPLTLRDIINDQSDTEVLIRYILKICQAVSYIHKRNIIHRDIKPENILIDGDKLVLADFGIAHFKDSKITRKGDLLANRNYMAPEQKLKNNSLNVDRAADIYSLGLIINECFTKQNLSGSKFKLVADSYPLLFELDNLIENMIRQKPEDRISIDSVYSELKFIYKKLKMNLKDIKYYLTFNEPPQKFNKKILNEIYVKASEDILFGKYLFNTHSNDEIEKYNENWHQKIGYTVDDFLFKMYVQEKILKLCRGKFEYESNVYRADNWYLPLHLDKNVKDQAIYNQLSVILEKYDLRAEGYSSFDLSGKILKYFSSCAHYHCDEILEQIERIEGEATNNLKSSPIIRIVSSLKFAIHQNLDNLKYGSNVSGRKFSFEEHIDIDWDTTQHYELNDDDTELLDNMYSREEEKIQQILVECQRKWKTVFTKLDDESYSLKFATHTQFIKFRNYALDTAKPYYIFDGDVQHILRDPSFVGNAVELRLSTIFDIPTTLAQILAMKEIRA